MACAFGDGDYQAKGDALLNKNSRTLFLRTRVESVRLCGGSWKLCTRSMQDFVSKEISHESILFPVDQVEDDTEVGPKFT